MTRLTRPIVSTLLFIVAALLAAAGPTDAKDVPGCTTPIVVTDTPPPVLAITSKCPVPASAKPYRYNVVNILDGGELIFDDANGTIDFWAQAIIVEKGGKLTIGTPEKPIGTASPKNVVTIHLYGSPQASGGKGVLCASNPAETCGASADVWYSNLNDASHNPKPPTACTTAERDSNTVANCVRKVSELPDSPGKTDYKATDDDYFYGYHPLVHDEGDHNAYFGYKVLGVGYGGTLQLFGKKGALYKGDEACKPTAPRAPERAGSG